MVKKQPTIKDLQAQLDELLLWFEQPDVDLDEATIKYEQALTLVDQLKTRLANSRNKIEVIRKKFDE